MQLRTVFVTGLAAAAIASGGALFAQSEKSSVPAPLNARASAPSADGIQVTPFIDGFTRPVFVTNAADGSGRLFVVEQGGRVWAVTADGTQGDAPFLDISNLVSPEATSSIGYSERGLLGLAFDPAYADNGFFYVNYTDIAGNTVIARFTASADPDSADMDSEVVLLTQEQPYANHNGGAIAFGSDDYLYISLGDGGSAGDPQDNAQDTRTLLGKILRIDPQDDGSYLIPEGNPFADGTGGLPEIWALGLRNTWRMSFDRATGDFYGGDVGQDVWEEINFLPADAEGGANFGWNALEGDVTFDNETPAPANYVPPIATYSHNEGISVSGGYVYRGEALPQLEGAYFYGDWAVGTIWSAYRDTAGAWQSDVFTTPGGIQIASFGEDEAGELYIVNYGGSILRFTGE